jgi:hypothetical protein
MKRRFSIRTLALVSLVLSALMWTSSSHPLQARSGDGANGARHGDSRRLRFDVAENGRRFTADETPVHSDDGLPAYGNEFVTEGYIYPFGTIDGTNGVNEDGSPEFPDKVIGKWYCRGWHVGDGAHTASGPWVLTHQLYDLSGEPGSLTITSEGIELADLGVPFRRAITGGTGRFSKARGQVIQTFIGFPNRAGGGDFRFVLELSKE